MRSVSICLLAVLAFASASTFYDVGKDARLNEHNQARAVYGLPALQWDDSLAQLSQEHVNGCVFSHSDNDARRTRYCQLNGVSNCDFNNYWVGETMAWNTNGTWGVMQQGFYDEKAHWHCDTNTCDAGAICGHFTQIIWAVTAKVGCAAVVCDANAQISTAWIFSTCNYFIGGNWNGQHPLGSPQNCNGPVVPYTPNSGTTPTGGNPPGPIVPPNVPPGPIVPPGPVPPVAPASAVAISASTQLGVHNKYRATYHLVKLQWSKTHTANALKKAKSCDAKPTTTGTYGQSIAYYKGSGTPTANSFIGEKKYWTCKTDRCTTGHRCSRYRQLVWGAARFVGCAAARCHVRSPYGAVSPNWTVFVCNYDKKASASRPFAISKCP